MSLLSIIIGYVSTALFILFIAQMIFSIARISPYDPTWGPVVRFVYQITEPILEPIRRILPPTGMIDISPIIVLLILGFLRNILR